MERMLRQWETALEAYKARKGRRIRWDDYERVIQAVLAELQSTSTLKDLRQRYERGNFWVYQLARRIYPDDKEMWDLHYTGDVAFGLRYEELLQSAAGRAEADGISAEQPPATPE